MWWSVGVVVSWCGGQLVWFNRGLRLRDSEEKRLALFKYQTQGIRRD